MTEPVLPERVLNQLRTEKASLERIPGIVLNGNLPQDLVPLFTATGDLPIWAATPLMFILMQPELKPILALVNSARSATGPARSFSLRQALLECAVLLKTHSQPPSTASWKAASSGINVAVGIQWFIHNCATLLGDARMAARAVYICTAQFPNIGLLLFDAAYFSRDYAEELRLRDEFRGDHRSGHSAGGGLRGLLKGLAYVGMFLPSGTGPVMSWDAAARFETYHRAFPDRTNNADLPGSLRIEVLRACLEECNEQARLLTGG